MIHAVRARLGGGRYVIGPHGSLIAFQLLQERGKATICAGSVVLVCPFTTQSHAKP
jgi:hypothetical protein